VALYEGTDLLSTPLFHDIRLSLRRRLTMRWIALLAMSISLVLPISAKANSSFLIESGHLDLRFPFLMVDRVTFHAVSVAGFAIGDPLDVSFGGETRPFAFSPCVPSSLPSPACPDPTRLFPGMHIDGAHAFFGEVTDGTAVWQGKTHFLSIDIIRNSLSFGPLDVPNSMTDSLDLTTTASITGFICSASSERLNFPPLAPCGFSEGLDFSGQGEAVFHLRGVTSAGTGFTYTLTSIDGNFVTPEPSTWVLLGSGFVGLVLWRRQLVFN
jgi:hypothetical protein